MHQVTIAIDKICISFIVLFNFAKSVKLVVVNPIRTSGMAACRIAEFTCVV